MRIILAGHHSGSRSGKGHRCAGPLLRRSDIGSVNGRAEYLRSTAGYVSLKRGNRRSALPRSIICSNGRGSFRPGS